MAGVTAVVCLGRAVPVLSTPGPTTLHDFGATTLTGAEISFSRFSGKPVLVINVAAV